MNKLKEDRVRMLNDLINKIKEVSQLYKPAYPGWTLLQSSYAHANSLLHLESETNFDEETLGVQFHDDP